MNDQIPKLTLSVTVLLLSLSACGGGNGNGLDQNGQPVNDTGPVLKATLTSIQLNVFSTSCGVAGCHGGGSSSGGLTLDSEQNSKNNLINVISQNYPAYLRVNPSAPDNSVLIKKLEGTAETGSRMPLGKPTLSADTILVIRQWIANGAVD